MSIISIRNLSKRYSNNDSLALDNFSLEITHGEVYGLLGPNGAGKTTLISILCGLIKPSSGDFELLNLTYKKNSLKLRKEIGVVPQEYALYPTLSPFENLQYFGGMYGLKGNTLKKMIDENLDNLGLLEFRDKRIETFSGGMKRRINLIAGVLHNPQILFLDEPTVGVDIHSKNVIIEYLKSFHKKGTTIIYTSHHLAEAEDFCTQIAIIDLGKLIAQGTPKNLIEQTHLADDLEGVFLNLTGKKLRDYV